jgi:hypothetical protein
VGLAAAQSPGRVTTDALAATGSEGIRVRCSPCLYLGAVQFLNGDSRWLASINHPGDLTQYLQILAIS